VTTRRSGTAFWTALGNAGVRVRVLWAPYEVPPDRLATGQVLAGAGVPDLAGTPGRSTLLGAAFPEDAAPSSIGFRVRLLPSATGWSTGLPGPFLPGGGPGRMTVPVEVRRTAVASRLALVLPAYETELPLGVWGPRMPVTFASGDLVVSGLVRFVVLDAGMLPLVLAGPIEISPAAPWFPVSEPPAYVGELAAAYGRVPTLGTPGDLAALAGGVLPEEVYLADLAEDFGARSHVVLGELSRGDFDLLLAFVPTIERAALGLQRLSDPEHPRFDMDRSMAAAPGFGNVRLRDGVLAAYAFVDDLVGKVAAALAPEDTLVVLSDHGERPYRRAVHLNAWLRGEGLLVLRSADPFAPAAPGGGAPDLDDVDWARTQAYAVGGAYVIVNLRGREPEGSVEPGERYDRLVERIATKLQAWTDDGAGGAPVVRRVLIRGRDLRGRREDALPDLLVVFADPYRESDETVAGQVPAEPLTPNHSLVGADHGSGDAGELRGVFFSTRPLVQGDPSVGDIGATALAFFGVPCPEPGRGRDLWRP
jgi:predicted AlkP superfamily phosphohydrolase/phosphomutase